VEVVPVWALFRISTNSQLWQQAATGVVVASASVAGSSDRNCHSKFEKQSNN